MNSTASRSMFSILLFFIVPCVSAKPPAKKYTLRSPDGNITVAITAGATLSYSVNYRSSPVTAENVLSMTLQGGTVLGRNNAVKKSVPRAVNNDVRPLYGMAAVYHDRFTELTLQMKSDFSVVFRVYDNGVAYRFLTRLPGRIKITNEEVSYRFPTDVKASMMPAKNWLYSYEEHYVDDHISFLDSGKRAALPILAESSPVKVVITESDLLDYPGLYFTYDGNHGLEGVLPPFVLQDSIGGCCPRFEKIPVARASYIAETDGTRSFPWRLMVIAPQDKDLLYNDLVYLLASENKIGDASWIKPGKLAWDWWNANNLTGVKFKTGFNTETYKYFIDFAAANGIEYINMDEGWSDQFDLLKLNDGSIRIGSNAGGGLDMPFLFEYAKKKNVGIELWCVWHTLDRQLDSALDQFQKWGVRALKVDFMDRDDQTVMNFYERIAREAAKRKMLINFHGACKNTGLERTYPNVINREAVQGLEYNKFTDYCTPDHAAHIPFIRMVAGSMDYTPGGLYNASKKDFRPIAERPMTQGTRCQQLAFYPLLYAPLEMLADAPTSYEKEPEILRYLSGMPTTWDESVPLDGKVGQFAVIARRKNNDWFVSGITDWDSRNVKIDLSFLKGKSYNAEIFTDGPNANRNGNDYVRTERQLSALDTLSIDMAQGGGFAMRLRPVDQSADSNRLVGMLDSLATGAKNTLLKRHFHSVATMLRDTTHSSADFKRGNEELFGVLEFFRHDGAEWKTYSEGPRPLIMSFVSPTDHKNSYYWLFLPKGIDTAKRPWPLYVELHGSGGGENDDPRRMLLQPLRTKIEGVTSEGYRKDGIFILPWGRGDKGYAGIAETDIMECLHDVDSLFRTDPQRQYLYGFSMGGAGTFHIAQKTISRWTALGLYSAAFRSVTGAEAETIKSLPVWMAWGEKEPWAVNDRILKDMLLKAGARVDWREVKGVGHSYLGEYQEKMLDWFLQHSTGHLSE